MTIARAILSRVVGGGDSSTTLTLPGGASVTQTQSDYDKCVQTMTDLTWRQYPDTRVLGIFGSDANAAPRAAATISTIGTNCGPPPR